MRRLFDDFDNNFFNLTPSNTQRSFSPSVDINEDKENLYFDIELPGLNPEDVKVTISEGVLTIRGEKKHEEEHKDRQFYRMERSYGEFVRQFSIPGDVKDEDVKADFKGGVLEVVVPKKEPAKPKEREVQIGSGSLRKNGEVYQSDGHSKATNGQREKATA